MGCRFSCSWNDNFRRNSIDYFSFVLKGEESLKCNGDRQMKENGLSLN